MFYYHIRYDISLGPGLPLRVEKWTSNVALLDKAELVMILEKKHNTAVSISCFTVISPENFVDSFAPKKDITLECLN